MKKRKISIFVFLTVLIFLLSSCDISTLLDTLKGNAYEEYLGIDLVGEQTDQAVNDVISASGPTETAQADAVDDTSDPAAPTVKLADDTNPTGVDTVEKPKTTAPPTAIPAATIDTTTGGDIGDLEGDKVAVVDGSVPTLPKQTPEQKATLKSTVGETLSGTGAEEFISNMENTPAEDTQVYAAHNTLVIAKSLVADLNLAFGGLDSSSNPTLAELQNLISNINTYLAGVTLSDPPTQADILNVQLISNLVSSLNNLINAIAGDGTIEGITTIDTTDTDVKDAIMQLISDAAFLANVSKAQGSTSPLINSINISTLLSMFSDDTTSSAAKGEIPSDVAQNLDRFKATIKLVTTSILGVSAGAPATMDSATFERAIGKYEEQGFAFNNFLAGVKAGDFGYADINADDRAIFCGVTGLLNYTIITALANFESIVDAIALPQYSSLEDIVDDILDISPELVTVLTTTDGSFVQSDGTGVDINIPTDLETRLTAMFTGQDDLPEILETLGFYNSLTQDGLAVEFINNAIILVRLGSSSDQSSLLLTELTKIQNKLVPPPPQD